VDLVPILLDFAKMLVFGFVLGVVLAKVNLWIVKRDVRRLAREFGRELSRFFDGDEEARRRLDELVSRVGRRFGREVLLGIMTEFRSDPKASERVSKAMDTLKKFLEENGL